MGDILTVYMVEIIKFYSLTMRSLLAILNDRNHFVMIFFFKVITRLFGNLPSWLLNTIDDLGVLIAYITNESCLFYKHLFISNQVSEQLLLSFCHHSIYLDICHLRFLPEFIDITYQILKFIL